VVQLDHVCLCAFGKVNFHDFLELTTTHPVAN
jgi:hypothetical protein